MKSSTVFAGAAAAMRLGMNACRTGTGIGYGRLPEELEA